MTDFYKLTELLQSWGVDYEVCHNNMTQSTQIRIVVPNIENRTNVVGYSGFETTVEFNSEGNFVNIGIWG